ncbi:hypothetical protein Tco_1399303 [Tanacetum coccineum]
MVGIRGSTPEFSGPAFDAAVQRVVDALLPGLTTRLTNEIRLNGAGGIDDEKWIAHTEKIFEVLGYADEFKARSEQQKYERQYHTIRQRDGETSGEFMKRFLRLAGFVGKKAGPPEEHAKHFKWALCQEKFTDSRVQSQSAHLKCLACSAGGPAFLPTKPANLRNLFINSPLVSPSL